MCTLPSKGLRRRHDARHNAQAILGYGSFVTETREMSVVDQALAVIDGELLHLAERDMVTASDVTNLLLDLRVLLAPAAAPVRPEPLPA